MANDKEQSVNKLHMIETVKFTSQMYAKLLLILHDFKDEVINESDIDGVISSQVLQCVNFGYNLGLKDGKEGI